MSSSGNADKGSPIAFIIHLIDETGKPTESSLRQEGFILSHGSKLQPIISGEVLPTMA